MKSNFFDPSLKKILIAVVTVFVIYLVNVLAECAGDICTSYFYKIFGSELAILIGNISYYLILLLFTYAGLLTLLSIKKKFLK